jgi:hypothetical protein
MVEASIRKAMESKCPRAHVEEPSGRGVLAAES